MNIDHAFDLRPRFDSNISLGHTPRRIALLAALAVILGLVGGTSAFLIVRLVGLISNLALLHRFGWELPNLSHYHPGISLIGVCIGGAIIVSLLALWTPVIRGHGIPETLETILLRDSKISPRVLLAKPLSAAIAMGTGGPFGAEGPIIVTGGSTGSLLGQALSVSASERRILLATGAAAGMAGVFNTPIAAILLVFELLLFERSLRALVPLIIATAIAAEVHVVLLGANPLFIAHGLHLPSARQLPLFAALGLGAGALAVLMNKGLSFFESLFERSRLPEFFHPITGALGSGLIGLAVPGSLSVGYWAISASVNNELLLGTAALLCVAKLFSWWIALASNTSGGTLAPIFLVSATAGEMLGMAFQHLFPTLHIQPAAFALVAMGACFGAASRALLASGIFALEVTGSFDMLIPMLIAMAAAELVAEVFLTDRIMTDRLRRRGFRICFDAETDPFLMKMVWQAMEPLPHEPLDPELPTVNRYDNILVAVETFVTSPVEQVVVVDHDIAIGILTRGSMAQTISERLAQSDRQPATLLSSTRRRGAPIERDPHVVYDAEQRDSSGDDALTSVGR